MIVGAPALYPAPNGNPMAYPVMLRIEGRDGVGGTVVVTHGQEKRVDWGGRSVLDLRESPLATLYQSLVEVTPDALSRFEDAQIFEVGEYLDRSWLSLVDSLGNVREAPRMEAADRRSRLLYSRQMNQFLWDSPYTRPAGVRGRMVSVGPAGHAILAGLGLGGSGDAAH